MNAAHVGGGESTTSGTWMLWACEVWFDVLVLTDYELHPKVYIEKSTLHPYPPFSGVEAEAELLAALITFFKRVGLTSADVGIKISTRALLGAILAAHGVDSSLFPPIYVIVDKAEKLPVEAVILQLEQLGVNAGAVKSLLRVLSLKSIAQLCDALPSSLDNGLPPYVQDLQRLFQLMDAYGLADWVQFDASVVRGLSYYTGTVFEAFDRAGALRAICGGGRYDNLLSTLGGGGAAQPCVGFGFGDAVILELLRDRRLLPELPQRVDDVVFAMEPALHPVACQAATALRGVGRRVDLVLEPKRLKWALKVGGERSIGCTWRNRLQW